MRLSSFSCFLSLVVMACGGSRAVDGGTGSAANGNAGSSSSGAGGATSVGGKSATGGAVAVGGSGPASGGSGASGGNVAVGGTPNGDGGSGPIDCSNVGCGAPPVCGEPCGAPCGCCPCAEGEKNGTLVCHGGCYEPAPVADGGVACDPTAEEHRRLYAGTSPVACMAIKYACPDKTTPFQNACGCGCEQSATCPEWFDCMPSPGGTPCDTAQIKIDCPYSGIAF